MTLGRPPVLLGALVLVVGLAVLTAGVALVSEPTTIALVLVGVLSLVGATLTATLGAGLLVQRQLRPFSDLAAVLASDQPFALNTFLHSELDEVVAVAEAVQRTQSRLTTSLAQIARDRSDLVGLFEHMDDGVLVLDAGDRVELANPAAGRLLRQPTVEGRPLATAVRDPDLLELVRAARDGSRPVRYAVELRNPGGRRTWLQVIATRLPTDHRILVLLQDLTDLRRAETVRRDFVANISHELKTPVAALKALVETLEARALQDADCGPEFLRRMHVEVDGLAQLVAELLQLARIEAGRIELDVRACRADELIDEATDRIRPYAARLSLEVGAEVIEPELVVHADPRQIGQVLSNLLSNAVKFTPPGGRIELGARRDGSFAELWVRDSGVGIARDDLIRVFERFYKADPSRTGTGTGLGLAICKHVVQAHGGRISAESDGPGRGATFRFTLPAHAPQVAPGAADGAADHAHALSGNHRRR